MRASDAVEQAGPILDQRLSALLGQRSAGPLAKLGLHTAGDLLRHYPRRWAAPGTLTDLAGLVDGEHVTVMAEVMHTTIRPMRSRGGVVLQTTIGDGSRVLSLTFFAKHSGALRVHEQRLVAGRRGLFTGVVSHYRGEPQLTHPAYLLVGVDVDDVDAATVEAERPIPLYPASSGAPSWRIQQCVRTVMGPLRPEDLPDPIPADVLEARGLPGLLEALRGVHEPFTDDDHRRGISRLRFEEAFVLQAELARRRATARRTVATACPPVADGLLAEFDRRLPFTLTDGQVAVGQQIAADLSAEHPMQRLLQGDVGAGKTVVALRAMLQVVDAGGQAALLAPTEVLAAQHARTIAALLGDLGGAGSLWQQERSTAVRLLTGSLPTAARRQALADLASGTAGIVVGTHALLSDPVQFADLRLVVVDEQHRFGVAQRDALRQRRGTAAHLLVMTATPIPRTVAMTIFGDLETSVLAELPAGRAGVVTHAVPRDNAAWMARVWSRAREEVGSGGRVFVVCPRIDATDSTEPGDELEDDGGDVGGSSSLPDGAGPRRGAGGGPEDGGGRGGGRPQDAEPTTRPRELAAVRQTAASLRGLPELAGITIGELHGRMSAAEKDEAIAAFADGSVPVLVATTVIEVGVDIPDATAMVVLDADRFGLSQLHQLRGRIGRGTRPGVCLLVGDPAGSGAERLAAMERTTDGFELAATDLELRREGDVLGAAQSGMASSLRLLRVARDVEVIEQARADADRVVAADPELADHPALATAIARLLAGDREEYITRA